MSQKSIKELFDFTGKTAVVTGGAKGSAMGLSNAFWRRVRM